MALLLGRLVGSLFATVMLATLLEWAIVKRVVNDPQTGSLISVAAAAVLGFILYGFGNADGGAWNPMPGGIWYPIGGVIVFVWRSLHPREADPPSQDDLADTFR